MARGTPKICAVLDNHQADHQSTIVEFGGKIDKEYIFFLVIQDLLIIMFLQKWLKVVHLEK